MKTNNQTPRRGRPPKEKKREEYLDLRLELEEKQAFRDAAELAGLGLSTWVRERLRIVARKELKLADKPVAFLKK